MILEAAGNRRSGRGAGRAGRSFRGGDGRRKRRECRGLMAGGGEAGARLTYCCQWGADAEKGIG